MAPHQVARGDSEFAELPERRIDALDGDTEPLHRVGDIGRCAGPRTSVTRIAEHAGDRDTVEPPYTTGRQADRRQSHSQLRHRVRAAEREGATPPHHSTSGNDSRPRINLCSA